MPEPIMIRHHLFTTLYQALVSGLKRYKFGLSAALRTTIRMIMSHSVNCLCEPMSDLRVTSYPYPYPA